MQDPSDERVTVNADRTVQRRLYRTEAGPHTSDEGMYVSMEVPERVGPDFKTTRAYPEVEGGDASTDGPERMVTDWHSAGPNLERMTGTTVKL